MTDGASSFVRYKCKEDLPKLPGRFVNPLAHKGYNITEMAAVTG